MLRTPPVCPYCQGQATLLLDSSSVYQDGTNYGPLWICQPCRAWVGCHKNSPTHAPLGELANAEARMCRKQAHAAFDSLWKARVRQGQSRHEARARAYAWLARQLGIAPALCHIGMMQPDRCRQVVRLCAPYRAKAWRILECA